MSSSQKLQIQIQFLEETTHHLNTLEILLSLQANNSIHLQNINAALQVIDSIKSGADIMGFRILCDFAHRLSDSFQVLKAFRKSLEIDTDLHSLLLCGVDWLRHIVELLSVGYVIDEQWLAAFCYPVFEELHQRLGDSISEEAMTMLPQDRPRDIIHLLFQTEVEECLQRLESLLDSEFLREELVIMAAELGGLGEMLQLPAFIQLCKSIIQHLEADEAVAEIAQLALETWRQSQALILTNQIDSLPTEIYSKATNIDVSLINVHHELLHFISDIPNNSNQWESAGLITPKHQDTINVERCYCDL